MGSGNRRLCRYAGMGSRAMPTRYIPNAHVAGGWRRGPAPYTPNDDERRRNSAATRAAQRQAASRWDTSRGCLCAAVIAEPGQHKQLIACELLVATAVVTDEACAALLDAALYHDQQLRPWLLSAVALVLLFVCGVKFLAFGVCAALAQPLDAPLYVAGVLAGLDLGLALARDDALHTAKAQRLIDIARGVSGIAVLVCCAVKVRRAHWLGPDASENVEMRELQRDGYSDLADEQLPPAAARVVFPDDDPFLNAECLRMGVD